MAKKQFQKIDDVLVSESKIRKNALEDLKKQNKEKSELLKQNKFQEIRNIKLTKNQELFYNNIIKNQEIFETKRQEKAKIREDKLLKRDNIGIISNIIGGKIGGLFKNIIPGFGMIGDIISDFKEQKKQQAELAETRLSEMSKQSQPEPSLQKPQQQNIPDNQPEIILNNDTLIENSSLQIEKLDLLIETNKKGFNNISDTLISIDRGEDIEDLMRQRDLERRREEPQLITFPTDKKKEDDQKGLFSNLKNSLKTAFTAAIGGLVPSITSAITGSLTGGGLLSAIATGIAGIGIGGGALATMKFGSDALNDFLRKTFDKTLSKEEFEKRQNQIDDLEKQKEKRQNQLLKIEKKRSDIENELLKIKQTGTSRESELFDTERKLERLKESEKNVKNRIDNLEQLSTKYKEELSQFQIRSQKKSAGIEFLDVNKRAKGGFVGGNNKPVLTWLGDKPEAGGREFVLDNKATDTFMESAKRFEKLNKQNINIDNKEIVDINKKMNNTLMQIGQLMGINVKLLSNLNKNKNIGDINIMNMSNNQPQSFTKIEPVF